MLRRTLLLSILLISTSFSQAKVGTTGAQFLDFTTSVRSSGMGGVGVALIDRQAFAYNPASLGLSDMRFGSISLLFPPFDLGPEGSGLNYNVINASSRILKEPEGWNLTIAAQRIYLGSGSMMERTYEQGTYEGTGQFFTASDHAYSLTVATAHTGKVGIGFGGTVRGIAEHFYDYSATGFAIDLGGIVSIPLVSPTHPTTRPAPIMRLTSGVALRNFGPDMKFIEKKYPLPKNFLIGTALDLRTANWSMIASVEMETTTKLKRTDEQFGLEIGYRDATWGRIGRTGDSDMSARLTTFGASLSMRGIVDRVISPSDQSSSKTGFFRRVDLIVSYASSFTVNYSGLDGDDYIQIELLL
jgi:hypothetical protein